MPHNHEWQFRIKAVEREYLVMLQAAARFRGAASEDPTIIKGNFRQSEIALASENLGGTYLIRLFAEFETGARQFWTTRWITEPKTTGLIDGLAARCRIPDRQRDNAHQVREYRNALVHEREDQPDAVLMGEARSYLCHFFSYFPPRW